MKRLFLVSVLIVSCSATLAGPAAWFKWRSALGDHDVCAQFSPGDGWVVIKGPFEDSGCKKPGVPH